LYALNLQKNGTDDGLYEVGTGISQAGNFGKVWKWNNEPRLSWWGKKGGGEYCNMINGTDGSIFPPFVTKDRVLSIFNPELCRSLRLTYKSEMEYKGVSGYRFTVPADVLQDQSINPDNLCFCVNPKEGCPKSGVMQLSVCRSGNNYWIFLSPPYTNYPFCPIHKNEFAQFEVSTRFGGDNFGRTAQVLGN